MTHRQGEKHRAPDAYEGTVKDRESADLRFKGRSGTLSDMRHEQRLVELTETERQINALDYRQLVILSFLDAVSHIGSSLKRTISPDP